MPFPRIEGALPFAQSGNGAAMFNALLGTPEQAMSALGAGYDAGFKNTLDFQNQNYNNVIAGYQGTAAAQSSANEAMGKGFTDLYSQVLQGLQGAGTARAQGIDTAYARASSDALQGLASRGLGNTTVGASLGRGLESDRQRQQTALSNDLAQMTAGYQSQLGLAGLADRRAGSNAEAGLAQRQLDFMNSVNAPYPSAGLYAQLAMQYGAGRQSDADRGLVQQQMAQQARVADQASRSAVAPPAPPTFGGGYARAPGGLPDPLGGAVSTGYSAVGGAGAPFGYSTPYGVQGGDFYDFSAPAGEPEPYYQGHPGPAPGYDQDPLAALTGGLGYAGYGAQGPPQYADETDFGWY